MPAYNHRPALIDRFVPTVSPNKYPATVQTSRSHAIFAMIRISMSPIANVRAEPHQARRLGIDL